MTPFKTTVLMMMFGLCGNAALAGDDPNAPLHKTVSYADLDLSRTAGAQALYQRLNSAAKQVCAPADGASVAQKQRYRACIGTALSNAVAKIDQPLVTQVHDAKMGSKATASRVASVR